MISRIGRIGIPNSRSPSLMLHTCRSPSSTFPCCFASISLTRSVQQRQTVLRLWNLPLFAIAVRVHHAHYLVLHQPHPVCSERPCPRRTTPRLRPHPARGKPRSRPVCRRRGIPPPPGSSHPSQRFPAARPDPPPAAVVPPGSAPAACPRTRSGATESARYATPY